MRGRSFPRLHATQIAKIDKFPKLLETFGEIGWQREGTASSDLGKRYNSCINILQRRLLRSKSFGNLSISRPCAARGFAERCRAGKSCKRGRALAPGGDVGIRAESTRDGTGACAENTARRKLSCDMCTVQRKHVVDCLQRKGRWSARLGDARASQSEARAKARASQSARGKAHSNASVAERTKTQGKGATWFSAN